MPYTPRFIYLKIAHGAHTQNYNILPKIFPPVGARV
jgi:hypothetical protein